jgi:hypothetical protein
MFAWVWHWDSSPVSWNKLYSLVSCSMEERRNSWTERVLSLNFLIQYTIIYVQTLYI